ncbi:MAG: hypothetical protein AB1782_18665 [Cyanobacteriota bacterium]
MKREYSGVSTFEMAVLIALIAIVCIGILTTFGGTISDMFSKSKDEYKNFQPFGNPVGASSGGANADNNEGDDNNFATNEEDYNTSTDCDINPDSPDCAAAQIPPNDDNNEDTNNDINEQFNSDINQDDDCALNPDDCDAMGIGNSLN